MRYFCSSISIYLLLHLYLCDISFVRFFCEIFLYDLSVSLFESLYKILIVFSLYHWFSRIVLLHSMYILFLISILRHYCIFFINYLIFFRFFLSDNLASRIFGNFFFIKTFILSYSNSIFYIWYIYNIRKEHCFRFAY